MTNSRLPLYARHIFLAGVFVLSCNTSCDRGPDKPNRPLVVREYPFDPENNSKKRQGTLLEHSKDFTPTVSANFPASSQPIEAQNNVANAPVTTQQQPVKEKVTYILTANADNSFRIDFSLGSGKFGGYNTDLKAVTSALYQYFPVEQILLNTQGIAVSEWVEKKGLTVKANIVATGLKTNRNFQMTIFYKKTFKSSSQILTSVNAIAADFANLLETYM